MKTRKDVNKTDYEISSLEAKEKEDFLVTYTKAKKSFSDNDARKAGEETSQNIKALGSSENNNMQSGQNSHQPQEGDGEFSFSTTGIGPLIGESNYDFESIYHGYDTPNLSYFVYFDAYINDFVSVHDIIDPDSSEFRMAVEGDQPGIYSPRVVDGDTNQELPVDYFSFEVVNNKVEFRFTELGINELGLDDITQGQQLYYANFRIVDDSGIVSPLHTIAVIFKDGGTETEEGETNNNEPSVIPLIEDSNLDEDLIDGNSSVSVDSSDVADFVSIHEIIDSDSNQFEFTTDQDGQNFAPRVYFNLTNEEIDESYFSFEIVNGNVEIRFTEAGIEEIGLYSLEDIGNLELYSIFRVKDAEGNISQPHHIAININPSGSVGSSDAPIILDSEIDEDGVQNNDSTVISINADEFDFYYTIENGIEDENVNSVTVDQSWMNEPILTYYDENGNSADEYAMGQGQFVIEVINGNTEFYFTEEGIDLFDLNNTSFEGVKSFEISFRVIDEDGNTSDVHNITLNVNGSADGFGGTNNLVFEENNDGYVDSEACYNLEMNSFNDNQNNGFKISRVDQDIFTFIGLDNQNSHENAPVLLEQYNNSQIEVSDNPVGNSYYDSDLNYLMMEDFNF